MGGIKNKLSKLTSKVKTLFNKATNLPPLLGEADENHRFSIGGVNKQSKSVRLTIPLSDYCLTSPFSQRGTKSSLPLAKGRQMSVAHRWGCITKYTSITCLTLAILSTLVLNIVSSYSYSKVNSNAEPVNEAPALANSSPCSQSINAPSCISLSTTSSTGSNDPNISLSIPQGGGIATGRHIVTVVTNNVTGWGLVLSASNSNLVNTTNKSFSINSLPSSATIGSATTLANNTWGVALPYGAWSESGYYNQSEDYASTNDTVLSRTRWTSIDYLSTSHEQIAYHNAPTDGIVSYSRRNIYYGVRVDNPNELLAGNYQAEVVYTATTNEVPAPTMTSIDPNQYELGSGTSGQITITGTNLLSAYEVYLTNTNGDRVGECTNLNIIDDNNISCTIPTAGIAAGEYTLHVVTQGTDENGVTQGFTYVDPPKPSLCRSGDLDNTCQVDIDDNMIPVKYTGTTTSAQWTSIASREDASNIGEWYDYDNKQWANAVTVKNPDNYRGQSKVVNESDILGYWVYIPRYAYRVQRRDASNSAVSAQNFDIVFETKSTPKKIPVACSGNYLSCSSSTYGAETGTGWATHPAFTWGTEELNGFWIGKFETTGSIKAPTVLPNQYHKASEYIGVFYDIAKSIGQPDPNNTYGNGTATASNAHNLTVLSSHMLKNSEWGAVAYLASSKYGAGIASDGSSNVKNNASEDNGAGSDDGDGKNSASITGCGPYDISGSTTTYNCSGDITHQYQSDIGQLASTTGNEYGVYDMSGGAYEYVMGGYTNDLTQSYPNNSYITNKVKPPYVDLYNITSNNSCTWNASGSSCGGHALFETAGWGGDYASFVGFSAPWFLRGGYWSNGAGAGVFSSVGTNGYGIHYGGFRVVLSVNI